MIWRPGPLYDRSSGTGRFGFVRETGGIGDGSEKKAEKKKEKRLRLAAGALEHGDC